MGLFQEFQSHEKILGRRKLKALDFYLANIRPDLKYEDVVYKKKNFEPFDKWYREEYIIHKCYNNDMDKVSKTVVDFIKERDWDQFHSPENLAKSITIESGELLECFQWSPDFDKAEACKELADVVIYCILMANKLDVKLEDIVMEKLEENRKKYPVEKAKGKSTKYNKL